ncbi:Protein kinase-like domain [Penicillium roqueforti FM164]|uniref:Altered inheritance of mitochondria protein 9, mitochondrial n=1 Tax=Penicillium roqueforti (strain FM164) TaxID=1365484 RepID=W6QPE1_PENRF|nr:Protein kinase-like domain [Penicillium roqueforti FM164]
MVLHNNSGQASTIAGIPVPKVHAWNNSAEDNAVGAEYIIMEKANGVLLSSQWATMSTDQKRELIQSIIDFERSLIAHSFDMIGSIYYENDLANSKDGCLSTSFPRFAIGPIADRRFLEDGRSAIESYKGPWNTMIDYVHSMASREEDCSKHLSRFPRPEGIFGAPGSYQPTAQAKLDVISDFRKIASFIVPKDATVTKPVLWHTDFHADNIFVDPNNPSKIFAVIDWQSVHVAPLCQQVITPAFLNFNWPKPDEGLCLPSLPDNFQTLSAEEKAKAKVLRTQQLLYKLYEIQSGRQNKDVFRALQYPNVLGSQIISLVSQVLNDGETIIKGQLFQLVEQWRTTVGADGTPCLITFTDDDIVQQNLDQEKWEEGVQLMEDVLEALGGAENGWQGWVSHDEYAQAKVKLEMVKEQFLDHMAHNPAEREARCWAWPFQGQDTHTEHDWLREETSNNHLRL